jgi:hypothetical protein
MGGRGKKFKARKRVVKPPKERRPRKSRATKEQKLFFNSKAQKVLDAARAKGSNTVSFEALTGKRARAGKVSFTGGTGMERVEGTLPLSRISVMKSSDKINLGGKKGLDNVHKWRKGTPYDKENSTPFRVVMLKNGQSVLHPEDVTRFAHYVSTGGDTKSIRVVFNVRRITSKVMADAQAKFASGEMSRKTFRNIQKSYDRQMQIRALTQELRGDRTATPQRLGGTLGNRTGSPLRSEAASRSKETGVFTPFSAQSPTRKVYNQGVRRTSPKRKQGGGTNTNARPTIVPATESGRVALRRLASAAAKNNKVVKPKAKKSTKKKKNT